MNYVTKQKLAAIYIQNLLITEGSIATRRLRSDSCGLRVCSHQYKTEYKTTSDVISISLY